MKIALAQTASTLGEKKKNLKKLIDYTKNASRENAEVIIFPEMFDCGYNMEIIKENPSAKNDDNYRTIAKVAQENKIFIIVGLSDYRKGEIFNTSTVFNPLGEIETQYDKIHLFTGEPLQEQNYLAFGNHLSLFQINNFTAGIEICYDLRFPELSRNLSLKGANVLIFNAAWPMARKAHWLLLLKARALENQCYVLASNRCGEDKGLEFAGNSIVISPEGEVISKADEKTESLIFANLEINNVINFRNKISIYNDRREDLYQ